ncbi:prolipoprotein diacylglyceryl transferase [Parafilimonas sp.]|uniref:prolipoprotein diacylglyceryl transferase n=1 Tax=Parafilimonas sp. TaxID=1969739 RepID=UPI0039E6BF2A
MLFVHWNIDPEIFKASFISLRYYSLCFAMAFICAYVGLKKFFIAEHIPVRLLDKLTIYVFAGTLIGARLGDCFFYDWAYYKDHLIEIILPFSYSNGNFRVTGYQGLASHGGAAGILIAVYIYCKVYKQSFLYMLDRLVIAVALAGFFIRTGNFFNSEIIGRPSALPWAVVFERVDNIPRHPAQLYEALCYLILFFVLMRLYKKYKSASGFLFGWFLILIFSCRFLLEFVKENQESFESSMVINMGQLLSIPFIITGLIFILRKRKKPSQKAGITSLYAVSDVD